MTGWFLAPRTDRHRRHQLVFEIATSSALAAVTRQWVLVAFAGAICLPGIRRTWVHWLRRGTGLAPVAIAAVLVAPSGVGAVAGGWAVGCAIGIVRLGWAHRRRERGAGAPPSTLAEDQDLVGLRKGDRP